MITPADLKDEMLRLSVELDRALADHIAAAGDWARKENEYRKAKARSYLASKGTVDQRKAMVDLECENERYDCHLAEGMLKAAILKVEGVKAQLSAMQSVSRAVQVEMEYAGRV